MSTMVIDDALETPEHLMARAAEGRLTKHALASYLTPAPRHAFLDACASIEEGYTADCATDPCLAAGCSMSNEICLQPLLRAGTAYHKACAVEWAKLFEVPGNRT
jgi:hypothetical protein